MYVKTTSPFNEMFRSRKVKNFYEVEKQFVRISTFVFSQHIFNPFPFQFNIYFKTFKPRIVIISLTKVQELSNLVSKKLSMDFIFNITLKITLSYVFKS